MQAAAAELAPDKSLARLTESSKFFAGSLVTLLGTALTGLGLAASDGSATGAIRWIAGAIVALSTIAAALALSTLVPSTERIHDGNLDEIADWYRRRLRRGARLQVAGSLLVLAIVLAGAGAVKRLVPDPPESRLSMRVVNAAAVKLAVNVEVTNLDAGDLVDTMVIARRTASGDMTVFHDVSVVGKSGSLSVAADVDQVKGFGSFVLVVSVPARNRSWTSTLAV